MSYGTLVTRKQFSCFLVVIPRCVKVCPFEDGGRARPGTFPREKGGKVVVEKFAFDAQIGLGLLDVEASFLHADLPAHERPGVASSRPLKEI